LTRARYSFSLPVLIHPNPSLGFTICSAMVPVFFSMLIKVWILNPRERRQKLKKRDELRQKYQSIVKERKKEAEETIELMKEFVNQKRAFELSRHGLIIEEAYYGNLELLKEFPEIINVTIPLQSLVQNSQLHLTNTAKVS
jgi:DnaJ family protein C protein 11